jgi:hypothetical protein
MFFAKDRHQQSVVGGFDQEAPKTLGFVAEHTHEYLMGTDSVPVSVCMAGDACR